MSILSSPKTSHSSDRQPVTARSSGETARGSATVGGARFLHGGLRRLVFGGLRKLSRGRLSLVDAEGSETFGPESVTSPVIDVRIRDYRFYRHLAFGGSLGAAEAYILGYWDCEELMELLRLLCRDAAVSEDMDRGLSRLLRPLQRIAYQCRRNSIKGSRRNIASHYDQGDDFFSLFLDDTMAYSCAIFSRPASTLEDASLEKFARICSKLQLSKKDHLVEIGSGWGGFAVYVAKRHGCRVTTTTISRRQYDYTRRRVQEEGLSEQVTVLCQDYRHLTGQFDKLVSIEMIEAVGYEYLDNYFQSCSSLLKPDGMMLLQAITMPDQRFERYRRSVDFIQSYVFPGGCLPSLGAICQSLGRVTDLYPVHLEDISVHYAETLAHWRDRFQANIERIRALGFSEEFLRLWHFYFCYCEAGFRERMIGDVQIVLGKPERPSTEVHRFVSTP